jgi:regulatory protein
MSLQAGDIQKDESAAKKRCNDHSLLAQMQRLCAMREYTVQDISSKLRAKGCNEHQIPEIISKLIEDNYINEERYAVAFARDKSALAGWGQKKIEYALKNKGIGQTVIKNALDSISSESNIALLEKLLLKKMKELKPKLESNEDGTKKLREKLLRFALSRGFSYEEIIKVINKTLLK